MIRQKSEDNLGSTEAELERHAFLVTDLTKKVVGLYDRLLQCSWIFIQVEDLQVQANQAIKLKDQVDECVLSRLMTPIGSCRVDPAKIQARRREGSED